MLILSQRDPRWANTPIGKTTTLVKDKGCTITCISMATSWAGKFLDPGYLAKNLLFTDNAKIIWSSITDYTCLKFIWRGYQYDQTTIDQALKASNRVCLLNVNGGAHWVLGIYRVPFTNKFWVADPWTGSRKFYSGVIGYAILEKK